MALVNFISTTLTKYNAITTKDSNSLYFIEDAKRIYKGDIDVTESLKVVTKFDAAPGTDIAEGKLYVNATTFEVRIKNGTSWVVLSPGYISTSDQFVDANSGKMATIGATKAYITKSIANITGGTAFVKGITYDKTTGKLMVDKGEEAATPVELTGVAHNPTYDSAKLKLTIPVFGGSNIVVDIPKDKFVTAGQYNEETKNIELTIDGQTDPVLIPAAALVDVYTADNTDKNIQVTVSDDNKISASLTIDPTAGNALTYTAKGFMVNTSNKMNVYGAGSASELVISDAAGKTITRTGKTILSDAGSTELGSSKTQIPVASIVARAIATAVSAAQSTLQTAINGKMSKLSGSATDANKIAVVSADGKSVTIGTMTIAQLTSSINNKATKLATGNASEVLLSTADGNYARSGKTIGVETISSTPNANTLITEAAVANLISWKTI